MKINFNSVTIAYILVLGIMATLVQHGYLLNFSVDDSFFYIKTAFNNALGLGSTFDTINITNGYHPLWFYILTIFYYTVNLTGTYTPETIYTLTFMLQIVTGGISAGILHLIIKNISNIDNIQFTTIFSLVTVLVFVNISGMETQILALFLLLFFYMEITKKSGFLIKGIVLGLVFLARLDMVVFIGPAILFYYYFYKKLKIKEIATISGTAGFIFAIYLISNYIEFGHLGTISSKIKYSVTGFYFIKNCVELFGKPIELMNAGFILSIDILFIYLFIKGRIEKGITQYLFLIFTVASLAFLLFNQTFNSEGIRVWYFGFPALISCILLCYILPCLRINRLYYFIQSIVVLILYFTLFRINYYYCDDAYHYAKEIKNVTVPDDIIYQVDYSGLIAFYSERKIINGDGLINSFEYYDYLKTGRLEEYLSKFKIKYYSTYAYENPISAGIFTDKLYKPGNIEFKFNEEEIRIIKPKILGGIFRKRFGNFYLINYNRVN